MDGRCSIHNEFHLLYMYIEIPEIGWGVDVVSIMDFTYYICMLKIPEIGWGVDVVSIMNFTYNVC